jgi:hypothetical protein
MGGIGAFAGGLSQGLTRGAALANQFEDANAQSKMNEQRDLALKQQKEQIDLDNAIREASSIAARDAKAKGVDDDEVPIHSMQAGIAKATELNRYDAAVKIKAAEDTYRGGLSKKYFDLGDRTQNIGLYGKALSALTGTPVTLEQSPEGGLIYRADGKDQTISAKDAPGFLSRMRSPDTWRELVNKNAADVRDHEQAIELKRLEQTGQIANTIQSGRNTLATKKFELENTPIKVGEDDTLLDYQGNTLRQGGSGKDYGSFYGKIMQDAQKRLESLIEKDKDLFTVPVDSMSGKGEFTKIGTSVLTDASALLAGSMKGKDGPQLVDQEAIDLAKEYHSPNPNAKPEDRVILDPEAKYFDGKDVYVAPSLVRRGKAYRIGGTEMRKLSPEEVKKLMEEEKLAKQKPAKQGPARTAPSSAPVAQQKAAPQGATQGAQQGIGTMPTAPSANGPAEKKVVSMQKAGKGQFVVTYDNDTRGLVSGPEWERRYIRDWSK